MKLIKNIKKLVNNNPQIISKGKWVHLKFILGVDDKDFIFKINCGKIVSIEKRTVEQTEGYYVGPTRSTGLALLRKLELKI